MYSEEQRRKALRTYHRIKSVTDTVRQLGYPSREHLYTWIRNEGKPKEKRKKINLKNTTDHPRNPPSEFKLEVVRRCFENGESVKLVSDEVGYSRAGIYMWRRRYLQGGAASLMNTKNIKLEKLPDIDEKISSEEVESLRKQMYELQLEVDILKETINVIKKDPGVDWKNLKNMEKVAVIDAMKEKYPLPILLRKMNLSRSSYYYQIKALATEDKYKFLRQEVVRIFTENRSRYGYRRIHAELKKIEIKISEKVVRRVMIEENLEVKIRKAKKYSSYKGEISPAVPNEVQRNFHSEKPEELLLSDISEFAIPAGKVYLSPAVDCFDGMLVTWRISEHPNAELVNSMLDDVIANMDAKSKPIIHTDRGCHYRWTGWIDRMEINGYTRSMSQKGCSPDNAACEGLFGRIKNEFFYNQDWKDVTIEEFSHELDLYLHWYNEKRIKKSLGYLSPIEYRRSLGLVA
ncbi:IS3 family transposase [Anaerovoracaceae bacterium SGI.195]|nr:IS3 family transposase [Anaerovoracaceae bacterium]